MNFYEQQLRNIFGNDDNIKYIGRACYIGLDSETKVKASFVTGIVANQYNALRMEVLNRKDGCIDRLTLRFEDYFTRSAKQENLPHIWDDKGNVMWYGTPLGSELAALTEAAEEYVGCFAPSPEQTEIEEMEME